MCEIDITYYPFDEQVCALVFGAWSYHTSKMNLTTSTSVVNLDSYKTNGEWEIFSTYAVRNEFNYECCPHEKFSNVEFKVFLRRRHTFYVLNVILPSIMTSVLLLSVFFCTPNQKVSRIYRLSTLLLVFLLNFPSCPQTGPNRRCSTSLFPNLSSKCSWKHSKDI